MLFIPNSRCLAFFGGLVIYLLLSLSASLGVSAVNIEATVGEDFTLTCTYDAGHYGKLSVCWGRGSLPTRGCAGEVIRSDGTSVVSKLSERYMLLGDIGAGDVSLTVKQVQESDSGLYGCRVDIPGWFNDQKHHINLSVKPAAPHPVRVELREARERTITVRWIPGQDGGRPITSYRIDFKNAAASWDMAVTTADINPALTQVTLNDMRPYKSYIIRMFAVNSVGMSEASNVLAVTTKEAAPEGPPLDVQLEALSSRSIKVTWKPPKAELRNGVLLSYSVSYREYDPAARQYKRWHHQSVAATRAVESLVLSSLKPSTKYSIIIQAKTIAGIGLASTLPLWSTLDEVRPTSTSNTTPAATTWEESTTPFIAVPPDPPVLELMEVNDKKVSLCWVAGFDGGVPVMSYDLEYKEVNASWDSTQIFGDFSPNLTETTMIEMHPSTYNFRMFARNRVGLSEASNVLTVTVADPGQQSDPFLSTMVPADTQAAVSVEDGGGGILAAITVPLVLMVLVVAATVTWKLRRVTKRAALNKSGLGMTWLANGVQRFRNSEPVPEL